MKKQLGFIDLFWVTSEEEGVPYWVISSIKIGKVITRKQIESAVYQILERYPVLLSRLIQDNKEFYLEYPEQPSAINLQEYIMAEKGEYWSVIDKLAKKTYNESREPMFYVHHLTDGDSTHIFLRHSHVFLDGASTLTIKAILIHNLLAEKAYLPELLFEFPENYIRQITSTVSGVQFPGKFKRYLIGFKEFLYLLFRHPFKPQIFNKDIQDLNHSKYTNLQFSSEFTKVLRSIKKNHDVGANTVLNYLILSAYSITTGNNKVVNVYPKNIRNETDFTLGNLISPNFVSFEYDPTSIVVDKLISFQDVIQTEMEELENLFVMYLGKIYPKKTLKNAKKEGSKSANGNLHTSNAGKFPPYSIANEISSKFLEFDLSELNMFVRPKNNMGAVFNIFRLGDKYTLGISYVPALEDVVQKIMKLIETSAGKLEDQLTSYVDSLFF